MTAAYLRSVTPDSGGGAGGTAFHAYWFPHGARRSPRVRELRRHESAISDAQKAAIQA